MNTQTYTPRVEIPVTSIRETGEKIEKTYMGYSLPVFFTVNGEEKKTDITARLKRDLPNSLENYRKRAAADNLKVTLGDCGRIESVITLLY